MRPDFPEIVIERPRYKSWLRGGRCTKERVTEETDLPSKEGMKRMHILSTKFGTKELNDNLSPLWRFLDTKIGCNWDDVWSEICEYINSNGTLMKHVRDHILQYVDLKIKMIDGVPHEYRPHIDYIENPNSKGAWDRRIKVGEVNTHNQGWERLGEYKYSRRSLYVNSDTNILECYSPPSRKIKYPAPNWWHTIPIKTGIYEWKKGLWYFTTTKIIHEKKWKVNYLREPNTLGHGYREIEVGRELVPVTRTITITQLLNKKELRALKNWFKTRNEKPSKKLVRTKYQKRL